MSATYTSSGQQSNEQRYYDALRKIARGYRTSESIIKHGDAGLDGYETLEYVYDNLQNEAERAIHGKRRPKS